MCVVLPCAVHPGGCGMCGCVLPACCRWARLSLQIVIIPSVAQLVYLPWFTSPGCKYIKQSVHQLVLQLGNT